MEAVLLSLESRIDDREVDSISWGCDDVSKFNLLGIHIKIVASESHLGGVIGTLEVP